MSRSLRARSRPARFSRPDALVMATAIALAAGCGGKVVLDGSSTEGTTGTGTGTTFVCDDHPGGNHVCVTITNPDSAMFPALELECADAGGTMPDACATTDLLGICTETDEGLMQVSSYYADGEDASGSPTDTLAPGHSSARGTRPAATGFART
jgi:hypothetical protein